MCLNPVNNNLGSPTESTSEITFSNSRFLGHWIEVVCYYKSVLEWHDIPWIQWKGGILLEGGELREKSLSLNRSQSINTINSQNISFHSNKCIRNAKYHRRWHCPIGHLYCIELVCLWIGLMGLYPCYDYKSTCSATNSFYFVLCT